MSLWPKTTPSHSSLSKIVQIRYSLEEKDDHILVQSCNVFTLEKEWEDYCTVPLTLKSSLLHPIWIISCLSDIYMSKQVKITACLKLHLKYYDSVLDDIWSQCEGWRDREEGWVPPALLIWERETFYPGSHVAGAVVSWVLENGSLQDKSRPTEDNIRSTLLAAFPSSSKAVKNDKPWESLSLGRRKTISNEMLDWLSAQEGEKIVEWKTN